MVLELKESEVLIVFTYRQFGGSDTAKQYSRSLNAMEKKVSVRLMSKGTEHRDYKRIITKISVKTNRRDDSILLDYFPHCNKEKQMDTDFFMGRFRKMYPMSNHIFLDNDLVTCKD